MRETADNFKPYVRRAYYYETDKMGIVHHSNYIRWFEEARIDFMRGAGLDCAALESRGILIPVTGVEAKYRASVFFDEKVAVYPHLVYFNGIRVRFRYEIYAVERNALAVTGESGHCFIDGNSRRPVNMKKFDIGFYTRALELVEDGTSNGLENKRRKKRL